MTGLDIYHEVNRRLHDGTSLRVSAVKDHPDLVNVMILAPTGYSMYTGTLPLIDALGEIPYQIDRARAVEAQLTQNADAEEGDLANEA